MNWSNINNILLVLILIDKLVSSVISKLNVTLVNYVIEPIIIV